MMLVRLITQRMYAKRFDQLTPKSLWIYMNLVTRVLTATTGYV